VLGHGLTIAESESTIRLNSGGNNQSFITEANGQYLDISNTSEKSGHLVLKSGRVGIGTTAPASLLSVALPSTASGDMVTLSSATNGVYSTFGINTAGSYSYWGPTVPEQPTHEVVLTSAGNVGIGTTAPTAKLHVAGNIAVDGTVTARYQDVAEWVDAPEPLDAGTVVIVDPAAPNRVVAAARAYDTRVAGAVSHTPGLILGTEGNNKSMVAQSGRVRVKADASYGPIAIGDLLVTSPTAGYAMRSKPLSVDGEEMHRPGTLLGKALEALPNGRGEILVLLTLQ
jgi:hypothetical protein